MMRQRSLIRGAATTLVVCLSFVVPCLLAASIEAAAPTVEQTLNLAPKQAGVDIDRPTAAEVPKCRVELHKPEGQVGWLLKDGGGLPLRWFADTNGDNLLDQWSYYKDGIEVYRDIDTDANRSADQSRWFHTAGMRWGVDEDEDGRIDTWKAISAEEVTSEVVAALAGRDARRFLTLVLPPSELSSLGTGEDRTTQIAEKIRRVPEEFAALLADQPVLSSAAEWIQFSGNRPGLVPAGTGGSTKDLRVYENVVAMVRDGQRHVQVQIGTLIGVGDAWRVIDVPHVSTEEAPELAQSGLFFRTSPSPENAGPASQTREAFQQLIARLEELDSEAENAVTAAQQAELSGRRADLLEQIAAQSGSPTDRATWLRQLADMVSAAAQSGTYPDGVQRLEVLYDKLLVNADDKELAAYVRFRQLTADYGQRLRAPNADLEKIQADWVKNLDKYVQEYPNSADAAEAMLQLGLNEELVGEEGAGKKWYEQLAERFPDTPEGKKARGAIRRQESLGTRLSLQGKTVSGNAIDLQAYRGKVVLVHYWSTRSALCKSQLDEIKTLIAKHGAKGFSVLGIIVDRDQQKSSDFLASHRLSWQQIYDDGGLDGRLASELGIFAVPTMILIDREGKVVNYNVQLAELDGLLPGLLRGPVEASGVPRKQGDLR